MHELSVCDLQSHKDERLFTQALLLAPQDSGYYIRTDSLHVLSRSPTGAPLVEALKPMTGSAWVSGTS